MQCKECGYELEPGEVYCPICGTYNEPQPEPKKRHTEKKKSAKNHSIIAEYVDDEDPDTISQSPRKKHSGEKKRRSNSAGNDWFSKMGTFNKGVVAAIAFAFLLNVMAIGFFGTRTIMAGGQDSSTSLEETLVSETQDDEAEELTPTTEVTVTETPTPTPTAKPTATPTPTAKPTATPTPTAKPTATPTPTPAANSSEYILAGSDSRYITTSELDALTADQIRIARNEIYARHGRKFKDASLQSYFNARSWYTPTIEPENFVDENILNSYELANRNLIVSYESSHGYTS